MRFLALIIVSIALLSGCAAKMAKLSPATKSSYFVLEKDVYQQSVRGLLKYKWVIGLKAGTYRLVAEDQQGYYFQGEGDTVFFLSQERADRYLTDGYITPYIERYQPQLSSAGGQGGVWIPKDATKGKAKLYYVLYMNQANALAAGISSGATATQSVPVSTGGGMVVGAATTSIISSMVDGTVQKLPLDMAVPDSSILKIIDQ